MTFIQESPSFELLFQCLRDPSRMYALDEREWDALIPLARLTRLFSRLGAQAAQAGVVETLPDRIRSHFTAVERFTAHRQRRILWELEWLDRVLANVPVPIVLLKGCGYLKAELRASRGRVFGDVDLLVPRSGIAEVEKALRSAGWVSETLSAHDERYYREWMHEIPPLRYPERGVEVDIHHNISPLTSRIKVDVAPLFARASAVKGSRFLLPLPEDMLLHSAVHLFYNGEFDHGLRDLSDQFLLLQEGEETVPEFWEGLMARAELLNLERPLYYAMRYTQRILGLSIPDAAMSRAAPHGPKGSALVIMDALIESALLHKSSGLFGRRTTAARSALWMRSHLLKMPPGLLAYHLFRKMGQGKR